MADEYDAKPEKGETSDEAILAEAKECFERCAEAESSNRTEALDDIRFVVKLEQWDPKDKALREREGRPCHVIDRLGPVIRQVVNDARQNRPSIKVHPVDDKADPATADVMNGLIRNIEYASDAEVAYDTALECAVMGGFGYFRINTEYAHDDSFEQDIRIRRIANPFTVYGDPDSTAADSSDWNKAFVVETIPCAVFERKWKGAEKVDWDAQGYVGLGAPWFDKAGDRVMVAEYWTREEVQRAIVGLSDGTVVDLADAEKRAAELAAKNVFPIGQPRMVRSYKVTQRIMTGAEVLETTEWPGKYIPIVPVYGDEKNVEGERILRSLVRPAKDAQKQFNYGRSVVTELIAMSPKTPFIGVKGQFETDAEKWATANTEPWAHIEYDPVPGYPAPQRQPFAGVPAGAMQDALNAADDIKAITGVYDASLGARSNETSGRAIMARQREGDTSTFHYIDNLSRAIRHAGRILIDLIPKVYSTARIVRVLGPDETAENVPVNQPVQMQDEQGNAYEGIYDLTAGKYDLTVTPGPSYTTKREEAASQMVEFIRAYPAAAPIIGDLLAKNLDWPGADEIAKRLKKLLPPPLQDEGQGAGPNGPQGPDPQTAAMIQQGMARIQQLEQENAQLKQDAAYKAGELQIKAREADTKAFQAETDRMEAVHQAMQPSRLPRTPRFDPYEPF